AHTEHGNEHTEHRSDQHVADDGGHHDQCHGEGTGKYPRKAGGDQTAAEAHQKGDLDLALDQLPDIGTRDPPHGHGTDHHGHGLIAGVAADACHDGHQEGQNHDLADRVFKA